MTWKLLVIVVPICLLLDLVWLGLIMKDFYARELGDLARRQAGGLAPRWGAALVVYLLIPTGLVIFASPASDATWPSAVGRAALFGLVLYGVYDLTNLAILEKWTLRMTLADIAWGTTLCGVLGAVMRWSAPWWS
ncbi:MAG: DUF2177 family protein [Planctomycetia bacterium]|nr:DUF2177 family protein [Planctomycetia bacterium]